MLRARAARRLHCCVASWMEVVSMSKRVRRSKVGGWSWWVARNWRMCWVGNWANWVRVVGGGSTTGPVHGSRFGKLETGQLHSNPPGIHARSRRSEPAARGFRKIASDLGYTSTSANADAFDMGESRGVAMSAVAGGHGARRSSSSATQLKSPLQEAPCGPWG